MRKKIWKKLMALGLSLSLVLGYGNVTTLAATTVKGTLDGGEVVGRLTKDSSSATASTSYGRGGGYTYATATVYYWWGAQYYKTTVGPNFNNMGGVSAKAVKKLGGAEVIGAKGVHKVVWGAYTWTPANTTTGTIKENADTLY